MVGRDITIGRYTPRETPLHRMDPRLKITCALAAAVLVFIYDSGWAMLAFAAGLLAVLVAARLPVLSILASLRAVWVIVIITALLQFFLTPGRIIWSWGFLSISESGLYNGLMFSSRIVLLVVILAALTMTTPPLKIADALDWFLRPLAYLKVPVGRITTVVSITLMFIPNILDKSHSIIRAQMARGADFESWNVLRRVRDIVPVLVPLFVRVFKDAEELATAMESRAYTGGEGRTRLHPLKAGAWELLIAVAFAGGCVALAFVP